MSKSTAFFIAALALCLGLIIGVLAMSSQVEDYKKEKKQAEAALKDVAKKAEIAIERVRDEAESAKKRALRRESFLKTELNKTKYAKDRLVEEMDKLKSRLTQSKNMSEMEQNKTRMSGGFTYKNVLVKSEWPGFTSVIGEIINDSSTSYSMASFKISLYDKSENLIGVGAAIIMNFEIGQTKSFQSVVEVDRSFVAKCKIDLETAL